MALENNLRVLLSSTLTQTVGVATATAAVAKNLTETLSAANVLYTADTALSGTSDSYDLSGTLTNPLGEAAVFAKVMAVYIKNKSARAMTIGGANSIPLLDGATNKINLAAGATLLVVNPTGIAVTAGTGDLLIINGTDTDAYELIVIGQAPV